VPIAEKGSLFFYGNQVLMGSRPRPLEEVDEFGRNYLDQVFIGLCLHLSIFLYNVDSPKAFHSLTTRKDGDRYMVRLEYDDVVLEMEVEAMFKHFIKLLSGRDWDEVKDRW
jgi:hypothetical protein